MPSWKDSETSSDSLLSEFEHGADLSPVSLIPETIYFPDYHGVETTPGPDGQLRGCYEHDLPLHRFVAFEGIDTGRRFLGCGVKDGEICETVIWVDVEWPPALHFSLLEVWKLYNDENSKRLAGNIEYSEANYKLLLEKRDLERKNIELHKQLGKTLTEDEVAEITAKAENEKVQREMAEKQICSLKEEKKKLEYYIANLINAAEKNMKKLKSISKILTK